VGSIDYAASRYAAIHHSHTSESTYSNVATMQNVEVLCVTFNVCGMCTEIGRYLLKYNRKQY